MSKKPDYALNFTKICCIYLTAAALLTFRCGNTSEVSLNGGNTSEVSHVVMGTLYNPEGTQPADNATVTMRSRKYIPKAIFEKMTRNIPDFFIRISQADSEGHFVFGSVPTGDYIIEGRNNLGECVFIDSVSVDSSAISDTTIVSADTLKLPCTITGSSGSSGLTNTTIVVFIPGLDFIDTCDENGRFTLTGVPEGSYTLHIFVVSGAAGEEKTVSVKTEAGKTTRIGELYHITYSGNGSDSGVVPVDTMGYFIGDTVAVLKNVNLKRAGYTFTGWNTATDGSGVDYIPDTILIMNSGDVHLFAKWKNEMGSNQREIVSDG